MKKKINPEERARALKFLKRYKGRELLAIINSVSRSGMSRRIEFYAANDQGGIDRIGWYIAQVVQYSYDVQKGGLIVSGCGMDMIFHVIYSLNCAASGMDNIPYTLVDANEYLFPTRYST